MPTPSSQPRDAVLFVRVRAGASFIGKQEREECDIGEDAHDGDVRSGHVRRLGTWAEYRAGEREQQSVDIIVLPASPDTETLTAELHSRQPSAQSARRAAREIVANCIGL